MAKNNVPKNTVPKRRMCGASEAHARLCEEYPEFRVARGKIHAETELMVRTGAAFRRVRSGPITIPVVVHVLYKIAAQNIAVAQVNSQIEALNRDYGAANADKSQTPAVWTGLVTAAGIRFELATKDPHGRPTQGITRTKTKNSAFTTHDEAKFANSGGADSWPTDKFLNLWVCALGDGLLGYA
jgi:hypothetical protein